MLLFNCAGPAYYRMCSTDVYCYFQNKPAAHQKTTVAPTETITHHFFAGIGQKKKVSMQPKFVAAQKNVVKQKPSKHS